MESQEYQTYKQNFHMEIPDQQEEKKDTHMTQRMVGAEEIL